MVKKFTFFLIVLLLIMISCNTNTVSEPLKQEIVPLHKVNDLYKTPKIFSVNLFLIVDRNLSRDDALKIVNHYKKQYSQYPVINIDMFCDDLYANHASIVSEITDDEYYSHVLYDYFYNTREEKFNSRSSYGSACK